MRRVSEQKVSGGFAPIFASICSRFYKENVLTGDVARYLFYFYCLLLQKCRRFFVYFCCRTPQGVRGLKCIGRVMAVCQTLSHPARGAWIEIAPPAFLSMTQQSHPARGAWIEIRVWKWTWNVGVSRTPQGVRGLKCFPWVLVGIRQKSHPARGAWIEICVLRRWWHRIAASHPARGAWIEMLPPTHT